MTDDSGHRTWRDLHDFDIRREGRSWSREEIERKYLADEHPDSPGKMELVDGKLFHSEAQRLTMLGWMLEMVGTDAAVRLGDTQVWRSAIDALQHQEGPAGGDLRADPRAG